MAVGVIAGDPVADAIDTDDHADALPEEGVVRQVHFEKRPEVVGCKDGPSTPGNVVDCGETQAKTHPAWGWVCVR